MDKSYGKWEFDVPAFNQNYQIESKKGNNDYKIT